MSIFYCEDCNYSNCEVHGNRTHSFVNIQDTLKFIKLISFEFFVDICNFLSLEDISYLDIAFVNSEIRPIWNKFLEENHRFTIVGFNEISKLKKLANWLKIKKCKRKSAATTS